MPIIKVEVKRKSDNKLVYGNEGDQVTHEAMFDSDTAKYSDASKYTITKTDVTAEKSDEAQKIIDKGTARMRLKLVSGIETMTLDQLRVVVKDLVDSVI